MRFLLGVVIVLGCGKRDAGDLHRVEFPGFSLDLPASARYTQAPDAYRAGVFEMPTPLVRVSWHDGQLTTVGEMPKVVAAAGTPDGLPRSIKVGAGEATRIENKTSTDRWSVTDIQCGRRTIMLSLGTPLDVDKVLSSFNCHPDAGSEAKLSERAPIAFDDPAIRTGWRRKPSDAGSFVISNGTLEADFGEIRELATLGVEVVRKQIIDAYGSSWVSKGSETRGGRTIDLGMVTKDGATTAAAFTLWVCEAGGKDGMAVIVTSTGTDHAPAVEMLGAVRCAKLGDPPWQ